MSTLKKATLKSSTFWVNTIAAICGALLIALQSATDGTADATAPTAAAAANATVTVTPDAIASIASVFGLSTSADVVGIITIVLAVINQLLRYKTQRKLENQVDE